MNNANPRQRLDILLTEQRLARSRSHARDLIKRGLVSVDGEVVLRPGDTFGPGVALKLAEGAGAHVSRGAVKLEAALGAFGFNPTARNALDIGASTGGFTQVLLERDVRHVTAVDVGHGQLDFEIHRNERVTALEGFDARNLTREQVPEPVTAIVADVSFVSLTRVLPAALALAVEGCWLVGLIKPQFEVGREGVGKGGVVRDEIAREAAVQNVREWLEAQPGWRVVGIIQSPIRGGSGNQEFLIGAVFDVELELFAG